MQEDKENILQVVNLQTLINILFNINPKISISSLYSWISNLLIDIITWTYLGAHHWTYAALTLSGSKSLVFLVSVNGTQLFKSETEVLYLPPFFNLIYLYNQAWLIVPSYHSQIHIIFLFIYRLFCILILFHILF